MEFWLYIILGIALGIWACHKQVRDDKRRQEQERLKPKPAHTRTASHVRHTNPEDMEDAR